MAWFIPFLASAASAVITRRDMRKENARVLAANRAEQQRIFEANKAEAARLERIRKAEIESTSKENAKLRENFYKNLVSDAQSAGINPLTALRTGGGSAYGYAVQGQIRSPVMRDGVFEEGVMETPTLSRNPLAAGIEAGTNAYMGNLSRKANQSHDVRMAELRSGLNRADQLAIEAFAQKANMSPDGKLPPKKEWWRYMQNPDGTLMKGEDGYAIKREEMKNIPLQAWHRFMLNGKEHSILSLNMEAFESGPQEVVASAAVHTGAAGTSALKQFLGQYNIGKPVLSRNGTMPAPVGIVQDLWNKGREIVTPRARVNVNKFSGTASQ